jgi:hypothetical protein
MLPVQIWGNVAEWVGAVGTSGAAIAAVTYYIIDKKTEAGVQAKLIRFRMVDEFHPEVHRHSIKVEVRNDSDRPVSGFVGQTVRNADWAKLRWIGGRPLPIHDPDAKEPKLGELVVEMPDDGLAHAYFDTSSGGMGGPSVVPANSTAHIFFDHPFYITCTYYIIFRDAHARVWCVDLRAEFQRPVRLPQKYWTNSMRKPHRYRLSVWTIDAYWLVRDRWSDFKGKRQDEP